MGVQSDIMKKWREYEQEHMQKKINIASQRVNQSTIHIICRVHGNCKHDGNKQACMTCTMNTGMGAPFYQRANHYKERIEGLKYI